jgi:hypothetical protein
MDRQSNLEWAGSVLGGALVSFSLAGFYSRRASRQIEGEFSTFWQKHQHALREALKQSKSASKADAASNWSVAHGPVDPV